MAPFRGVQRDGQQSGAEAELLFGKASLLRTEEQGDAGRLCRFACRVCRDGISNLKQKGSGLL